MKKAHILFITLFLMALGFSCTDESKYPVPFDTINNSNAGILRIISQNSVILTTEIANGKYEVTFEANDRERGKLFDHVDLFVSFRDQTPLNGGTDRAEALLKRYDASEFAVDAITGLPRVTMTHTSAEIMTLMGVTLPEIVDGKDQFIFRQAMVFPDGRTFSSGNVNTAIAATGGVYRSPFQNVLTVYVCPSELGGDVDYVNVVTGSVNGFADCLPSISGTTTFTKVTHGVFALGDASFGQYDCSWGDKPATGVNWEDFCNDITTTGADQYSLAYYYTLVSNDGTTLVLDWSNDYGDSGQVSLTRAGGWPVLTFL